MNQTSKETDPNKKYVVYRRKKSVTFNNNTGLNSRVPSSENVNRYSSPSLQAMKSESTNHLHVPKIKKLAKRNSYTANDRKLSVESVESRYSITSLKAELTNVPTISGRSNVSRKNHSKQSETDIRPVKETLETRKNKEISVDETPFETKHSVEDEDSQGSLHHQTLCSGRHAVETLDDIFRTRHVPMVDEETNLKGEGETNSEDFNTDADPGPLCADTSHTVNMSTILREASQHLREEIESCLRSCFAEMLHNFNVVNNAFDMRIRETVDARNKMEFHFKKIVQEIFDMEMNIKSLNEAIQTTEQRMKKTKTCLEERCSNYNVNVSHSDVNDFLHSELNELRQSLTILKEKLKSSELSLDRLQNIRSKLEKDIAIKNTSIKIDLQTCMGMRQKFPMEITIGSEIKILDDSNQNNYIRIM